MKSHTGAVFAMKKGAIISSSTKRKVNTQSAVYHVALKKPSGISLVVNHCTTDVQVTSGRTATLVLFPVEFSTSISGSHTATYVVNAYVPQIRVYE